MQPSDAATRQLNSALAQDPRHFDIHCRDMSQQRAGRRRESSDHHNLEPFLRAGHGWHGCDAYRNRDCGRVTDGARPRGILRR